MPFPTPGDVPDTGIEPISIVSPALAGRFFTTEPPGKPQKLNNTLLNNQWVTEEITKEIRKQFEINENNNTMYYNLRDAVKAV